jgi:hypothetical protein
MRLRTANNHRRARPRGARERRWRAIGRIIVVVRVRRKAAP